MTNQDAPLIHTTRGNVRVDSLTYNPLWEFDTDPATKIVTEVRFIEEHRAADGEIVRRSVHVYKNSGAAAATEQGAL